MFNQAMILKWGLLVSLSALLSFALGVDTLRASIQGIIGMFLAVLSFVFIYIRFDYFLKERRLNKWRQALLVAVVLLALTQCFPAIHMLIGAFSVEVFNATFLSSGQPIHMLNFVMIYFITMIDGILLSIIVAGLALAIRLSMALFDSYKKEPVA